MLAGTYPLLGILLLLIVGHAPRQLPVHSVLLMLYRHGSGNEVGSVGPHDHLLLLLLLHHARGLAGDHVNRLHAASCSDVLLSGLPLTSERPLLVDHIALR